MFAKPKKKKLSNHKPANITTHVSAITITHYRPSSGVLVLDKETRKVKFSILELARRIYDVCI